jgi:pyruvate dehydrogenase E2 component (dihydrolipoamide acetyltransferase)
VTERLLHGALLVKATALALRQVPELNGFWLNGRAQPSRAIHVGVAISLRGGGLVAPALHDADRCGLDELMRRLQDLTKRARAGSLRSSEMTDPTITITSLGERGVESVFGIIYPPQLALVGFGRIAERPWVVDGRVVVQPVISATLSGDHRATDGHRGALLLNAIDFLLQEPEKL